MKGLLGSIECPFEARDNELFKVNQTPLLCFSTQIAQGQLGRLSPGHQGSRLANKTEGDTTGRVCKGVREVLEPSLTWNQRADGVRKWDTESEKAPTLGLCNAQGKKAFTQAGGKMVWQNE